MNKAGLTLLGLALVAALSVFFIALSGDDSEGGRGSVERAPVLPDTPTATDTARPQRDLQTGPAVSTGPSVETGGSSRTVAEIDVPAGLATNTRQTLSGRVAAVGRPLGGAQVLYTTRDGDALAEDTSDASGNFHLQAPYPLEDGMILVRARGYAPLLTGPHAIRAGERRFVGNQMLTQGLMLGGQVLGPGGTALEGARVELTQGRRGGGLNRHVQTAVSDHEGMFRFPEAPMGQVTLAARADGFGAQSQELLHQNSTDRTTLALVPQRTLFVVARDSRGGTVADALVVLRPHAPTSPQTTARTDESGVAHVQGLGSELWEVRIDAPGYRTAIQDRVTADGRTLEVEMIGWPCIRGTVTLPDGSAPPAGTSVKALSADARGAFIDAKGGTAAVQADGAFEVCDMRPGIYVIEASAPGWAPSRSDSVRITLGRDGDGVQIELSPGATLSLVVHAGSTITAGATCELWNRTPPPTELWRSEVSSPAIFGAAIAKAESNQRGEAIFEHVSAGEYWAIVRKSGLLPTLYGPFWVDGKGDTKVGPVRLENGGYLEGSVTLPSEVAGEPTVTLFGQAGVTSNIPIILPISASGSWSSPLLPPGRYRVNARVLSGSPPKALTAGTEAVIERGKRNTLELSLK